MKAVIVIDMPERCDTCPVNNKESGRCPVYSVPTLKWRDHRHPGCMLRLLPLKMSPPTFRDYEMRKAAVNYYAGWNDCIDRIEGGDEPSRTELHLHKSK